MTNIPSRKKSDVSYNNQNEAETKQDIRKNHAKRQRNTGHISHHQHSWHV